MVRATKEKICGKGTELADVNDPVPFSVSVYGFAGIIACASAMLEQ
jgi:hypothetical protein